MFISLTVPFSMTFDNSYRKPMPNTIFTCVKSSPHKDVVKLFLRIQVRTRQYSCFPSDLVIFRIYEKLITKTKTYFKQMLEAILSLKLVISNVNFMASLKKE